MNKVYQKVDHGMLLDGKAMMDNVIYRLHEFKNLIPECLHQQADQIIKSIEDEMVQCNVGATDEQ